MTKTAEKDTLTYHTAIVCRRRGTSYTCIRVKETATKTHFVPMETLQVEKIDSREFHNEWEPYEAYPVRRAAELYLQTPFRQISSEARAHLEQIVVDPTTVYDLEPSKPVAKAAQLKKEPSMAKAKKVGEAAATPVAAKKAPAAKKVAAPAKAAAKTAAPTKAPAKQPAPAKAAAPAAGRAPDTTKYQVIESEKPRRGETAEYVAVASKMKTFTRQALIDAMVKAGKEEAKARVKVADMVYFKVVEPVA